MYYFFAELSKGHNIRPIYADRLPLIGRLSNLTEEERTLINNRYVNDYTQSETSKIIGLSQVQVSRYETKILRKIRNNIERGIAA